MDALGRVHRGRLGSLLTPVTAAQALTPVPAATAQAKAPSTQRFLQVPTTTKGDLPVFPSATPQGELS